MKEGATEVVGVEGENEEAKGEVDGEEEEDLSEDEAGFEEVGVEVGLWGSWLIWSRGRYFFSSSMGFLELVGGGSSVGWKLSNGCMLVPSIHNKKK